MNELYKRNVEESTELSKSKSQEYMTKELEAIENGLIKHNSANGLESTNFKTQFDSSLPYVTWTPTVLTLLKLKRKQAFG